MPPLYTNLVLHFVDDSEPTPQTGEFRIPLTPFDLTDAEIINYATIANAVKALTGGSSSSFLSKGGITKAIVEVDLDITGTLAVDGSDMRDQWEVNAGAADGAFRRNLPGANKLNALLQPGTKGQLANLSATAWAALITALTTHTKKLVEPETGNETTIGLARSAVRPRAKPRIE